MGKKDEKIIIVNGREFIAKSSKGRRLRLKVDGNAKLYVYIPRGVSFNFVSSFVSEKSEWIDKAQKSVLAELDKYKTDLDHTFFKGRKCNLIFTENIDSCEINGTLYVKCKRMASDENKKRKLEIFFKESVCEYVLKRLPFYENLTGLYSKEWEVRKMRSRWGSCRTDSKRLTFNTALAKVDETAFDYVILHEVAHLKYPDHGREFKAFLTRYMPDWRQRKKLLSGVFTNAN